MPSLTSSAWETVQERTRAAVAALEGAAQDPAAALCRSSYAAFVKEFWDEVPGAGRLVWNWHLDVLCGEMQRGAERVFLGLPCEEDLVVNVVFGSSKSTICSILFHPWTWTRTPQARHLTVTHTETLALDLANKSRAVIRSEKYRGLFPEIELRRDTDAKSYQMNSHGGVRQAFTVSGKNPTGFHFDYLGCLPWKSRIITDGGLLPIGRIVNDRLPVKVLGFIHDEGRVCWQKIESYQTNPIRPLDRITFTDGTQLEATEEHPVYVVGRGYVDFGEVVKGDKVIHVLPLQTMREGSISFPGPRCEGQERMDFLLTRLPGLIYEREESSDVLQDKEVLRTVRKDFLDLQVVEEGEVLQHPMSRANLEGAKALSVQAKDSDQLRVLREGNNSGGKYNIPQSILQSELREQDSRQEDVGGGERELSSWQIKVPVSIEVWGDGEEGQEAGALALLPLRQGAKGQRVEVGRSSHRLRQGQLRQEELGGALPKLPCKASYEVPLQETQIRTKVVSLVERAVRIPKAVYNLGVSETRNYFAEGVLVHNCDDVLDPQSILSEAELANARDFLTTTLPTRKRDKMTSWTFLIMQRLRRGDPTDVLLEVARREGARGVRRICLPGEVSEDVHPPELKERYVNGLLDQARLPRPVLEEYRARLGAYGYSAQVMQSPVTAVGGMFRPQWFSQRVPAAPHEARRIRYWDRASTAGGEGAATVGVLMARAADGRFYIEHVARGRWEPDERNEVLRATAFRDRDRYGPGREPVIWVEAEGGSAGRDAWKAVARALAGFPVFEDRVTGAKDLRAEPWAAQLAAGNVLVVEDGTWDIAAYVEEHLLFRPEPGRRLGRLKDQIDASSGAFNLLIGKGVKPKELRIFRMGDRNGKALVGLHVLAGSFDDLKLTSASQRILLVVVRDPGDGDDLPEHGFSSVAGSVMLHFADLDPAGLQERWLEPLPPWNELPDKLVMSRQDAKKAWSLLLRKRDPQAEVWCFADSSDGRRAASMATAAAEVMGLKENLGGLRPDSVLGELNRHVVETMKAGRGMVVT